LAAANSEREEILQVVKEDEVSRSFYRSLCNLCDVVWERVPPLNPPRPLSPNGAQSSRGTHLQATGPRPSAWRKAWQVQHVAIGGHGARWRLQASPGVSWCPVCTLLEVNHELLLVSSTAPAGGPEGVRT